MDIGKVAREQAHQVDHVDAWSSGITAATWARPSRQWVGERDDRRLAVEMPRRLTTRPSVPERTMASASRTNRDGGG